MISFRPKIPKGRTSMNSARGPNILNSFRIDAKSSANKDMPFNEIDPNKDVNMTEIKNHYEMDDQIEEEEDPTKDLKEVIKIL